jgi:hypothetical protein
VRGIEGLIDGAEGGAAGEAKGEVQRGQRWRLSAWAAMADYRRRRVRGEEEGLGLGEGAQVARSGRRGGEGAGQGGEGGGVNPERWIGAR